MDAAPRHVDGFDFGSAGFADRLIIAVANGKIISDRSPEPAERKDQRLQRFAILATDGYDQPAFLDTELKLIGSCIAVVMLFERLEMIFFATRLWLRRVLRI